MLPKEDSKNVVVKKSYRQSNGKSKWWFTVIAPPSTLPVIEEVWPALQARSRWSLQISLRKHHLPPSHLPSPPNATIPNSIPLPPAIPTLPDSDKYPAQPHAPSSPTSTHCPPCSPHAKSTIHPPHSPPDSAPLAPSAPFLEGTSSLLGGPPLEPAPQE